MLAGKKISVRKAIWVGLVILYVPSFFLVFAPVYIFLHFYPYYASRIPLVLSIDFILAWLWWACALPKWRLWAYDKVTAISMLKIFEVTSGLSWPEGHFFRSYEIKSARDSERERLLLNKYTAYPDVVDPKKTGEFGDLEVFEGGYVFDEVLEYRVWSLISEGANDLHDGEDYYHNFANYEHALVFKESNSGTFGPYALIRQFEWIEEINPGEFASVRGNRIAIWKADVLPGAKRSENSMDKLLDFLNQPLDKQIH